MADKAKAKSAKERLEAAKKSAEEAEVLGTKNADVTAATDEAPSVDAEKTEDAAASESADSTLESSETADREAAETQNSGEDKVAGDNADAPESDNHETDTAAQSHDLEEHSGSIAATILKFLAFLVVGGVLALWAGPRIAPNLPGWAAPVAAFLTPGTNEVTDRINQVASENQKKIDGLSAEIDASIAAAADADAKASDALASIESTRADLSSEIAEAAKEPRADLERMNDLATRLVTAEATIEGFRAEIDALSGISTEDAAPSAEVLSRVAAFGASVEGLRAEIADLKERTSQIETLAASEDLAALTARVAALEEGEAATSGARDEASNIRRDANIAAAITRIEQALLSGAPFAPALADATSLSGESAPSALTDNAADGLPTQEDLMAGFPSAAQAAYAAALEENAGDSFTGGVFAKLQGRLGGRPSVETEGDDAGAVLSRIEARLKAGRLADALSEASGLSSTAQAAMSGWLEDLTRAIEGAAAFATYRDALTAN